MKDNNALFWHKINVFCALISRWYYTWIMRARCFFRQVHLGTYCTFYGKTFIQRSSNSSITIDDGCQFRSKHLSALLGINHPCIVATIVPYASIKIGKHCGFSGTTITAFTSIHIGNNVRCATNTTICDSDWHLDDPRATAAKPIVIEDNVWLGYNVTVWKGVTIGKNSLIGAHSVVTKDIPANVVAAGNPCQVIKQLDIK